MLAHRHARPNAVPKPPPDPEVPPPIEDPMPPEPPIEEPEPDPTVPVAGRAVLTALGLLLLAGCQQAVIPEEPVNERPELNLVAEPDNGPAPLTVELRANARDPEGEPLTYTWSVAGASPEAGEALTYTFEEPGEYIVELTVSDGRFDSETDSVTILVRDPGAPEL